MYTTHSVTYIDVIIIHSCLCGGEGCSRHLHCIPCTVITRNWTAADFCLLLHLAALSLDDKAVKHRVLVPSACGENGPSRRPKCKQNFLWKCERNFRKLRRAEIGGTRADDNLCQLPRQVYPRPVLTLLLYQSSNRIEFFDTWRARSNVASVSWRWLRTGHRAQPRNQATENKTSMHAGLHSSYAVAPFLSSDTYGQNRI